MASSLSVKAAKGLLKKEKKKEMKISFEFQLYFWFSYGYSVAKKCFPELLENNHISQTRRWNVFLVFGGWYVQSHWFMSSWYFYDMLAETATTGGRENQCAVKWIRGFPHLHQERSKSFQFKRSLLNEKEFLLRADTSCLLGMRSSYILSEVSGNSCNFGFILFFVYIFLTRTGLLVCIYQPL